MANVINLIDAIDQTTSEYVDFILNLLSVHSDLPLDADEVRLDDLLLIF